MIPISDNLQPTRTPVVTWLLLGLNFLVFFFHLGLPEKLLIQTYYFWGLVPARLTDPQYAWYFGDQAGALITLLTSMFIHGGWLHLLANSWTLWLFGDDVEDKLGHLRFTALYLASGLIGGLTHLLLFSDSTTPLVGASGAVAGLMGAYLYLFPHAKINVLVPILFFIDVWKIPAVLYLPFWFIGELFSGTFSLVGISLSNVAFWAHIGGFIAGLLLVRAYISDGYETTSTVFSAQPRYPDVIYLPGRKGEVIYFRRSG